MLIRSGRPDVITEEPAHHLGQFVKRLKGHSLLTSAEEAEILGLPASCFNVPAKRDFVGIGDVRSHCYFIASGLVAKVGQVKNGARQITSLYIAGDIAELQSTVHQVGIGGLTALRDTVVLQIAHSAICSVAASSPAISEAFWRECTLDAAILLQWTLNLGRKEARARLAHLICEMAIRYGDTSSGPLLDFKLFLSQEQFGDATVLTSVHVNRCLRALREEGLATVHAGRVQIHDWDRLASVAEFNPAYLLARRD